MPFSYFLSLPPELRNRIYELCTPVCGYVEEFEGLRQTSQQIRAEYETEAVGAMRAFFQSLSQSWPYPQELRIEWPQQFAELEHVTIQLPVSLYYPSSDTLEDWLANSPGDGGNGKGLESSLAPLFSLHISSLKITFYDDSDGLKQFHYDHIPGDLLRDFTNVLVREPTRPLVGSPDEIGEFERRARRSFRLAGQMNVRRLYFQWIRNDQTSGHVGNVQTMHVSHFLRNQWWWSGPMAKSLVTNWGRGDDCVFFDIGQATATASDHY